jgi:hypothetical protein
MDFNIEDIFDDTDDIESIIDVETVFANIIKCVLVGNKIEKIIKKNKIAIVNIINKNKPKKKVDEQEPENEHEIDEKEEENEPNNDTRIIIDEKNEDENANEKEEENEQKDNDKILNEEFEEVGNIEDKVINKYYKIIALKCHPDKCKNEKFNKYFILAQEAYKKKDMLILLFIYAKTINDYKCVTKEELSYFSTIVDDLDKDQQNKCSSILYQWDRLTEDEKNMYIDDVKRKNNL